MKGLGSGLASSISELDWATWGQPEQRRFDVIDILRTPYRIDVLQSAIVGRVRRFAVKGFVKMVQIANLTAWLDEKTGHHRSFGFGWGRARWSLPATNWADSQKTTLSAPLASTLS